MFYLVRTVPAVILQVEPSLGLLGTQEYQNYVADCELLLAIYGPIGGQLDGTNRLVPIYVLQTSLPIIGGPKCGYSAGGGFVEPSFLES